MKVVSGKWLVLFMMGLALNARAKDERVLRAGQLNGRIRLDGRLTEPDWFHADSIIHLTMIEPHPGGQPTARTVVRVLANRKSLYIGVMCYDPEPEKIVAYSRGRDARLSREDYIALALDTFNDGRTGYIFRVNPAGARYDALVMRQGEDENSQWDAVWDAETHIGGYGWSVEIHLPIKSLTFQRGGTVWGFNIERRIQRLQETDRWSGATIDYEFGQTQHAGRLIQLPSFDFGLGLTFTPSSVAGVGVSSPGAATDFRRDFSLDIAQRFGSNLEALFTLNTDFAETEVDARQTNLTRFPLFFPEKRTFFLRGADIFEFGLGLSRDIIPFFSRRIGLYRGRQIPIDAGLKLNGRVANTNIGALITRTRSVTDLTPASTMGVVRIKQNIWRESSTGFIATFGDPLGRANSWLLGADFTYQTSFFRGNKNFLVGIWALYNQRADLNGDKTAYGFKIDYPNDLWDIAFVYKYIGDAFQPSLGFVPRPGIKSWRFGVRYSPRPRWKLVRQMFHEFYPFLATNLQNQWESYRIFTAPVNWRFESGDRFEFNVVPQGENLPEPFEIAENVVIPVGAYHWLRYRLEAGLASKRKISGQVTWWFGGFYSGRLDQIEFYMDIKPSAVFVARVSGELNYGRLKEGDFTQRLFAVRLSFTPSPDLQLSSFIQYDNESNTIGTNTRLRWTFSPDGDLFIVYNHNLAQSITERWRRESYQLLFKVRYSFWH